MPQLLLTPWRLSVLQWPAGQSYAWINASVFHSVTQTPDELSLVCETAIVPENTAQNSGWRCLVIDGILDFALVGILARISTALAEAGISIFAISSYNTDYILLKEDHAQAATEVLRRKGYAIIP